MLSVEQETELAQHLAEAPRLVELWALTKRAELLVERTSPALTEPADRLEQATVGVNRIKDSILAVGASQAAVQNVAKALSKAVNPLEKAAAVLAHYQATRQTAGQTELSPSQLDALDTAHRELAAHAAQAPPSVALDALLTELTSELHDVALSGVRLCESIIENGGRAAGQTGATQGLADVRRALLAVGPGLGRLMLRYCPIRTQNLLTRYGAAAAAMHAAAVRADVSAARRAAVAAAPATALADTFAANRPRRINDFGPAFAAKPNPARARSRRTLFSDLNEVSPPLKSVLGIIAHYSALANADCAFVPEFCHMIGLDQQLSPAALAEISHMDEASSLLRIALDRQLAQQQPCASSLRIAAATTAAAAATCDPAAKVLREIATAAGKQAAAFIRLVHTAFGAAVCRPPARTVRWFEPGPQVQGRAPVAPPHACAPFSHTKLLAEFLQPATALALGVPLAEAALAELATDACSNLLAGAAAAAVKPEPPAGGLTTDAGCTLYAANIGVLLQALQLGLASRGAALAPEPAFPRVISAPVDPLDMSFDESVSGSDFSLEGPAAEPSLPTLCEARASLYRLLTAACVSALTLALARSRSGAGCAVQIARSAAHACRRYLQDLPAGDWAALTIAPAEAGEDYTSPVLAPGTLTEVAMLVHEALDEPLAVTALSGALDAFGPDGEAASRMLKQLY